MVSAFPMRSGDGPIQERPGKFAGGEDRQSSNHGDQRRAQQKQRRGNHHQHHVLQHVRGEQEAVEHIHRARRARARGQTGPTRSSGSPGRKERYTGAASSHHPRR